MVNLIAINFKLRAFHPARDIHGAVVRENLIVIVRRALPTFIEKEFQFRHFWRQVLPHDFLYITSREHAVWKN